MENCKHIIGYEEPFLESQGEIIYEGGYLGQPPLFIVFKFCPLCGVNLEKGDN